MAILWILISFLVAVAAWLGFWMLITWLVDKSERQKRFIAATAPTSPPDGFYTGSAYLLGNRPVPWLGKSFESENQKGFNIFTSKGVVGDIDIIIFFAGSRVHNQEMVSASSIHYVVRLLHTSSSPGFLHFFPGLFSSFLL